MTQRHVARFFAAALTFAVVGCAGSGGGAGCGGGCIEPIAGGYDGPKTKDAVVARVSPDGFGYLNNNWKTLVGTLMPTSQTVGNEVWLPFEIPCTVIPNPGAGVGDFAMCDNGRGGPGTTGFMDGKCDANDTPCPVAIRVEDVKLSPQSPNKVKADLKIKLDALRDLANPTVTCKANQSDPASRNCNIYIAGPSNTSVCVWTKRMGCYANFYSDRQGRQNEVLSATVNFSLDNKWDELLTFDLPAGIEGIDKLEADDIVFKGTNRLKPGGGTEDMCDYACSLVGTDFIKDLIIGFAKPMIDREVKKMISQQRCRSCADPSVSCPQGSRCDSQTKVCTTAAANASEENKFNACVPLLLGMEGRMSLASMLGDFGVDPSARVDIFAAAGGSLKVGSDFQVGLLGGAKAGPAAACVPDLPPPSPQSYPTPDLHAEGPANHHVGLGVSEFFLNRTMYEVHRSGGLCLGLGTTDFAMLSSGLFKTFLPSLGTIAGTETRDAPMLIKFRPLAVPEVKIGEGTFDPVTKKPLKPLINLGLKDMSIDFYAMIEDRYSRIFTLTADIAVPLSLIVETTPAGTQAVTPALGDLKQLIANIKTSNSEMLAEDPQALAQLIPAILGMAEPALASALKPIDVPDMNGFRIKVDSLKGINQVSGSPDAYHHLGVFATLGTAGSPASYGPETFATLIASRIPSAEQMQLRAGSHLPWPVAVVEVDALDLAGNGRLTEYAYRVDGGLWSTWFDGPRLEIEHPVFLLQGRHVIEVRSRIAGDSESMADPTPAQVEFLVDWEAPSIRLRPDWTNNRLLVLTKDNVTPAEELQYAYRLGDEAFSSFGPAREIDLAAVEPFGSVEVQVRDAAGHVASAVWKAQKLGPAIEDPSASIAAVGATSSGLGCSAAGAGSFAWVALGALALLRRRRA